MKVIYTITYFSATGQFRGRSDVEIEQNAKMPPNVQAQAMVATLRGWRDNGGQGALPDHPDGRTKVGWAGSILVDGGGNRTAVLQPPPRPSAHAKPEQPFPGLWLVLPVTCPADYVTTEAVGIPLPRSENRLFRLYRDTVALCGESAELTLAADDTIWGKAKVNLAIRKPPKVWQKKMPVIPGELGDFTAGDQTDSRVECRRVILTSYGLHWTALPVGDGPAIDSPLLSWDDLKLAVRAGQALHRQHDGK